ncbi:MAG: radical SAM protein [Capsulimonadales bacterium]|nr:radical SAM protein [Capsulimonadales bacterium]
MVTSPAKIRLREVREHRPPTLGPESLGIALTNACNLNCITCWTYSALRAERPSAEWMRRRLSRTLLADLFREAKTLGTERAIFTGGGDPLAHPEAEAILSDAGDAGLKVTLISNLTLARDPERLAAIGIDTLLANFSCGDPESYVAFHPNRTAADFPRLVSLLARMASGGTKVKLVFVICSVNADALPKVIDVAGELGASIQFKLMSATDDTRSIALTGERRDALRSEVAALIERADRRDVSANFDTLIAELSGATPTEFPIATTGCYAGHYYARITANADVFYCCNQFPRLRIGSLQETSFTQLWHSERWQEIRVRLREGRFVPGCEQCGKFDLNRKVRRLLEMAEGTSVPVVPSAHHANGATGAETG